MHCTTTVGKGLSFAGWSCPCARLSPLSHLLGRLSPSWPFILLEAREQPQWKAEHGKTNPFFLYFYVSIFIKHNYHTYHQDLWGLFFAFMGVFNMGKAWPWLWQTPCPLPGTHFCHVWPWGIHHSGVSRTSNPSCTCALSSLQPHLPSSSSAFCTHSQPPQQFLCAAAFENHSQTSFIQASSQES